MVKEFRRLGHDAFLITSIYQDSHPVINPDEVKRRGGYVHVFDRDLGIPVIRVSSDGTTPVFLYDEYSTCTLLAETPIELAIVLFLAPFSFCRIIHATLTGSSFT